jgi:4-amino-4-deoxy-L-arabinose transferase-like glycosyltransferase
LAAWFLLRREDAEQRLGLVWFLTITVLLSCARFKRADYLLPAYPGIALFLGGAAESWYRTARHPRLLAAGFAVTLAACVAGWIAYVDWVLPAHEAERDMSHFAAEVRRIAPAPQPLLLFRTEAHAFAFHAGRPLEILVQWPDLERRTRQGTVHVVMPRKVADEMTEFPWSSRLEEVLNNMDLAGVRPEKPLVLLRTRTLHARTDQTAADQHGTDQPGAAGAQ